MSVRNAEDSKNRDPKAPVPLTKAICIHDDDEPEPKPVDCKPIISINGQDLKEKKEEDDRSDRAA